MNVKEIAQQVVSALPEDADFSDLDEFLFERAIVEEGRHDFLESHTFPCCDVLGSEYFGEREPLWSRSAAEGLREIIAAAKEHYPADVSSILSGIRDIIVGLGSTETLDNTLPEMGDPSIREIPLIVGYRHYRLIFDRQGGVPRVLWFTNNTSCYRNVKGRP